MRACAYGWREQIFDRCPALGLKLFQLAGRVAVMRLDQAQIRSRGLERIVAFNGDAAFNSSKVDLIVKTIEEHHLLGNGLRS
jgi:hypothetical protein